MTTTFDKKPRPAFSAQVLLPGGGPSRCQVTLFGHSNYIDGLKDQSTRCSYTHDYIGPMSWRQMLPLVGLILLGVMASQLLERMRPLGQDVATSPSAIQALTGSGSPQTVQGAGDLTVVMYTDYQCPVCRRVDPSLRAALLRDGNVRLVYKDWPIFGERSEQAAKVALAARRQGIYPSVHHRLMNARSFSDADLRAAVEGAGGDWQQLQGDLVDHGPEITDQLAANSREASSLGLQGTPGYLIGPILVEGALTEREFVRAFRQARAKG
ncbi:MAG: DsbA family protein [Croceibacterium sp.]